MRYNIYFIRWEFRLIILLLISLVNRNIPEILTLILLKITLGTLFKEEMFFVFGPLFLLQMFSEKRSSDQKIAKIVGVFFEHHRHEWFNPFIPKAAKPVCELIVIFPDKQYLRKYLKEK